MVDFGNIKLIKMPLKIIPTIATTLKSVGDTSIANINLQVVMVKQLQMIINQFTANGTALKNKLNIIGIIKVKIPSVKTYNNKKQNLRGF